ncbi:MAG: DUF2203 domain-containing protein [Vampirovibrionales bacterium]|nr:DUF2203 domain-containing protein [Vampirovibrionales bacterium]
MSFSANTPEPQRQNPTLLDGKGRFSRYYTLDEAAAALPTVRASLEQALAELETLKDSVILLKRILLSKKRSGTELDDESLEALKQRYREVEELHAKWVGHFGSQGIILRDLSQGLIDFPYYAKSLDEEFLLCWKFGEDGLFYFHPIETGFGGRQPIALLPE